MRLTLRSASNQAAESDPGGRWLPGKHVLYLLKGGKPTPVNLSTGTSDSNYTEILGEEVKEGDKVIVRDLGEKEKSGNKLKFRMF